MSEATQAGVSVVGLWRYPVKSMLGEEVGAAVVTERGLQGDRAYALIDLESGKVVSAKAPRTWGRLFDFRASLVEPVSAGPGLPPRVRITFPDGAAVMSDDPEIGRMLSEVFGRDIRLASEPPPKATYASIPVRVDPEDQPEPSVDYPLPNGFFDLGSLHLLATASLERLRELYPQGRFEVRRFRPNIVVGTPAGEKGFVENGWIGQTLAIGEEVRVRVFSPTVRCVMTTLPQGDLPSDPGILRTAAQHNQANVGVYAMVVRGGTVRRGDEVQVAQVMAGDG